MRRLWIRLASLVLAIGVSGLLFADDWRMFRKDDGRTAASTDEVRLPLEPAWSFKSAKLGPLGALSTAVVREGVVYFLSGKKLGEEGASEKKKTRYLFAVEAKTGRVKWSQPVGAVRFHATLPEDIGPVVTSGGKVILADAQTIYRPCPTTSFYLRAYDGESGEVLAEEQVPYKNSLSRFFLRRGHGQGDYLLQAEAKPES